ncbi:hypothetical protein [Roseibium sp.]|uniref:hypothetical protein n=1 Tax=Roseibium sp. TaxID=1936156 RepID=UPI003B529F83
MTLIPSSGKHLKYREFISWTATVLALIGLAVLTVFPVLTAPRVVAAAQSNFELAQYRLPDGSLPYICVIGAGESSQEDGSSRHCPLCTLCEASILPFEKIQPAYFLLERRGLPLSPARIAVVSHASGGLGPRAPPAAA